MTVISKCCHSAALLLVVLLLCAPARAQVTFDGHYARAVDLYKRKSYEAAIGEFKAAYESRQLPRILLNIGQAYRKLGQAREALKYYEHFLRVEPNPDSKLKADVDEYIARTRAMLELPGSSTESRPPVAGPIGPQVKGPPAPAVRLPPVGPLSPVPGPQVKGPPAPAVRLPPGDPLSPVPGPQVKGPPAQPAPQPLRHPFAGGGVVSKSEQAPLVIAPEPMRGRPLYRRWWFWTAVGVVAAGAVTGIVVATRPSGQTDVPSHSLTDVPIHNAF